jgi:hypothetical protein
MLCLYYYLLYFVFNKIGEQEGRTGSARKWSGAGGRGGLTMYTHMNKYKNKTTTKKKTQKTESCVFTSKLNCFLVSFTQCNYNFFLLFSYYRTLLKSFFLLRVKKKPRAQAFQKLTFSS